MIINNLIYHSSEQFLNLNYSILYYARNSKFIHSSDSKLIVKTPRIKAGSKQMNNKFNSQTIKALKDSRNGKNLTKYNNIDELLKKCWK